MNTTEKPRPLTAEERKAIEKKVEILFDFTDPVLVIEGGTMFECVRTLRLAEQFWREAVKNTEMTVHDVSDECPFCAQSVFGYPRTTAGIKHQPDCPWLRAQKPE